MEALKKKIVLFIRGEDSPTFLEYGLLIIVIALVVVAAAALLGSSVTQMFQGAATYSS